MMLYWFLPAIIFLGIITTYTDLKEGKIKNKHIIIALVYAFVAYLILISLNLSNIRVNYFIELITMCSLSLTVGFVIWYAGLWTAGDAKLFFVYSSLIPLSVYEYGHIRYFDSANILVNTFTPIFPFMSVNLFLKTSSKQQLFFLKKSFIPKQTIQIIIFLFSFSWLINILLHFAKIPQDYFLTISVLFLLMAIFEKLVSLSIFKITIIIGILRLIFDPSIYSIAFLKWFTLLSLVFILLRFFIIRLGFNFLTKEIDIKLLKPGMIPADIIYQEDGRYKKQGVEFCSLFNYLEVQSKKRSYLIKPTSEGLTGEEVSKLKSLEKNLGFEHIRVQQTIPFAPFMFLGVLITIVSEGNMFIALRFLLSL